MLLYGAQKARKARQQRELQEAGAQLQFRQITRCACVGITRTCTATVACVSTVGLHAYTCMLTNLHPTRIVKR